MVYSSYTAKPLRPFDPEDVGDEQVTAADSSPQEYEVYDIASHRQLTTFTAHNDQEALDKMEELLRRHGLGNSQYNVRKVSDGNTARDAQSHVTPQEDNWEIYRRPDNRVMLQFHAHDGVDAYTMMSSGEFRNSAIYGVRPISRAVPDAPAPEQGTWARYIVTNRQGQYVAVSGRNDMSAAAAAFEQHGEAFSASNIAEVHRTGGDTQPRAAEMPPATTRIFWRVTGSNGQYVSVPAADEQEAQSVASRRYGAGLGPSTEYTVTRIQT
jgi:hypothetical protein